MDLAAKLKDLRERAGYARGLGRALTQSEVARAISDGAGGGISQSYLSQIEGGRRLHLSQTSRERLARFFGVHPGYLVSDPEPTWHVGSHHTHATLARLAAHPRRHHIWPMVEQVIDLPDDDFHWLRSWLEGRSPTARHVAANGRKDA